MLEEFEGYDFTDVNQVTSDSNTDLQLFIHTQALNLRNDEAFAQSLAHILSELVQNFEC